MKIKRLFYLLLILLISLNADAGIYEFKALSEKLGYPNSTYFGSAEEEIQDLETYTSKEDTFYKEINSYLRYFPDEYEWNGISPTDAKIMVQHIDRIFDRAPTLPKDLILFRGLDLKFRGNKSYKIGEELIEKGYVSTSTSINVAEYFAVELPSQAEVPSISKKAVFTYYLNDKKIKGLLIDESEAEVLLKHGIKIKVMELKNEHIPYDFYLAQICVKVCAEKTNPEAQKVWETIYKQRAENQ